jgi:hypothetical protein
MFPDPALLALPVTCRSTPPGAEFLLRSIWSEIRLTTPESASSTPARRANLGIIDKHPKQMAAE